MSNDDLTSDHKFEDIRLRSDSFTVNFEARRERALKLLEVEDSERTRGTHLYIGLSLIRIEADEVAVGRGAALTAIIQRVHQPPGEIELAAALKESGQFGYVTKYARAISHELIVPFADGDPQTSLNLGWAITSLMRICSQGQFIAPAYCSVPWSAVPAIKDRSCVVGFLDEYPKAVRFDDPPLFKAIDFDWVEQSLSHWFKLWEIPSFRIAAESYCSYFHHPNQRLMVANLWSGIEAFFDDRTEVSFRLSLSIASLLEPRGKARIALCEKVRKLYTGRSAIVHGKSMTGEKMQSHIREASAILARLLMLCVERGTVWTKDQVTTAIMS